MVQSEVEVMWRLVKTLAEVATEVCDTIRQVLGRKLQHSGKKV